MTAQIYDFQVRTAADLNRAALAAELTARWVLSASMAMLTGNWLPVEIASVGIHQVLIALAADAAHELEFYGGDR